MSPVHDHDSSQYDDEACPKSHQTGLDADCADPTRCGCAATPQDERYAARVHQILVWQRPPRDMAMQTVARALGVSVRSLRRYLTAEGTSYAAVVREAQAAIAKTCLLERRTIAATAYELGFADSSTFHRAFKRWIGVTPSAFRKEHARMSSESRVAHVPPEGGA